MQLAINTISQSIYLDVTQHAALRMQQRGIAAEALNKVLSYGRRIHAKGMLFRVVGHKEVARYAARGVDLKHVEGVHALVSSDGAVVTVYRSNDLHAIRAPKGRGSKKHKTKLH
jgi:hypothetical protein